MSDIRCEAVGPVIQKDFVVIGVSEWDCIAAPKRRATSARRGQSLPMQSLAKDESGDGAICIFSLIRPFDVAPQVRRFALQDREIVGGYVAERRGQSDWLARRKRKFVCYL